MTDHIRWTLTEFCIQFIWRKKKKKKFLEKLTNDKQILSNCSWILTHIDQTMSVSIFECLLNEELKLFSFGLHIVFIIFLECIDSK